MVDTHALGACAARCEGSSPFSRTKTIRRPLWSSCCFVAAGLEPIGEKCQSALRKRIFQH